MPPSRNLRSSNQHHRHDQRMDRFFLSAWLCPLSPCNAALPSCFSCTWLSPHLSLPVLSLCCKYSWGTWSRQYPIAPGTATCVPFVCCMLTCILTWARVTRWSPPLAMCTCFVVSDKPSFRKVLSIRLKLGHSESHGARSLFVVSRQLCQGYASLNGLVWVLTHERFSLSPPPV